ncbi:MAG: GNAT family N-acetyltransferase [Pseudomonadota bacterium]|nr:GNAT family N-acetyltransferase [Pseudomonadota bacterium]
MQNFEGPRSPKNEEFKSLISFLDSNLRNDVKWSIADEYPTTYALENLSNLRIIKDGESVLSHAALKSEIVRTHFGLFKVAAIGGVVTSKEHRAQGLSGKILENCLALAQKEAHDIAILWTNLYDHYRKLGFELAGTEVAIIIDKPFLNEPSTNLNFIKGFQVSSEAIERVYSQHSVISLRKASDIARYLQIPNSNIYTAWNKKSGQLVAYAVEGKGSDLSGYIHEWGGGVSELISLFNYISGDQMRKLAIISPAHSENLIRQLKPYASNINVGFLGMIKILNRENIVGKIQKQAMKMEIKDLVSQNFIDLLLSLDEKVLTQIVFGPHDAKVLSAIPQEFRESVKKLLPMAFWIWGWDSV